MAATTHIVLSAPATSPLALWHLLSLDAPSVAVLWTWFIARAAHLHLPLAALAAMAAAVWILYAADRLLDTRSLDSIQSHARGDLEERHLFHHRHRRAFCLGIFLAGIVLAVLLPRLDPSAMILYLIEGTLLAVWFLILHITESAHRLPKEIAVGFFFSAATFIPTACRVSAAWDSRLLTPLALLLAALFSLNCLFIYAWEHDEAATSPAQPAHATTRLALSRLPALAKSTAAIALALALTYRFSLWPIPAACALAAALLLLLHRRQGHLSRVHQRAAADLALLTPLLLFPFLR